MYNHITGKLVEKHPTRIIIETNGMGYVVNIPLSTFDKLGEVGAGIWLLLSAHIRPEAWNLYGFHTEEERTMFNLLLTVSGVGPKSALAALSSMSARQFQSAIAGNDLERISLTPGIGKKTAQRITLELKEKVKSLTLEGEEYPTLRSEYEEAALALVALGYNRAQAERAVNKVLESGDGEKVEVIIQKALSMIAK